MGQRISLIAGVVAFLGYAALFVISAFVGGAWDIAFYIATAAGLVWSVTDWWKGARDRGVF